MYLADHVDPDTRAFVFYLELPNKVVIDRGVTIPEGMVIGENADLDAQRFYRTDEGVTLVTIPMRGGAESLNVGMAGTVVSFLFIRAYNKKVEKTQKYKPVIVEILG